MAMSIACFPPPGLSLSFVPLRLQPLPPSIVGAPPPPRNPSSRRRWALASAGKLAKRREALEHRGRLDDPSHAVADPSLSQFGKRRGRKGREDRAQVSPPEEPKKPRSTHSLLKVLGGKVRRKKLLSVTGLDVRPMMEVVRGAAFSIMQVAGGCPTSLRPGRWLDLYSGTGSVGIEAMSRGCSEAHFVEVDPWVVSEVLMPNLKCTGFTDNSTIHTTRVECFLEQAGRSIDIGGPFEYVSVTPPYAAVDYSILMEQLSKSPLIGKDSFILVEYPPGTKLLESCGDLMKMADRRFGRTHLAVYAPTWAQKRKSI